MRSEPVAAAVPPASPQQCWRQEASEVFVVIIAPALRYSLTFASSARLISRFTRNGLNNPVALSDQRQVVLKVAGSDQARRVNRIEPRRGFAFFRLSSAASASWFRTAAGASPPRPAAPCPAAPPALRRWRCARRCANPWSPHPALQPAESVSPSSHSARKPLDAARLGLGILCVK